MDDTTLPVIAYCMKDVHYNKPTKAELWPREKNGGGLGLGVLALLDVEHAGPTSYKFYGFVGASYQVATRNLLQKGTWVNNSKTLKALEDKLEKYKGGFETYDEEENASATSWFVGVRRETTSEGRLLIQNFELEAGPTNWKNCQNIGGQRLALFIDYNCLQETRRRSQKS